MSIFREEVKKRIGPYMKAKGFRLRGRRYYYIKNDIAYCISFEQPTGLMYTWAHVNPLYMPDESISLSYGNRLNNMADIQLPLLLKWGDSVGIDEWCELFFRSMDDHILPFFQQIDTPEKLLAYVEQPNGSSAGGKIWGSKLRIDELRIYSYLYLHDYGKAIDVIGSYQNRLLTSNLIVPLRERLHREADELKLLISQGDEAVDDFCKQTIADTKKLFQKPK